MTHPVSTSLVPSEPALRATRIHRTIYEDLCERIRVGEWLPGQRLPSITQLAKELGVGTGSVREALRSLQSIGLVKIEHGRGVFVTGARPFTDLSSHFQNVGTGLIVALAETRRILEPELAALAAERGTDAELAEIEALAQQGLGSFDPDMEFHRRIARAARNPILHRMMESVADLLLESCKFTSTEPGMTARSVRYHLLIAEALRDRNAPQARLLMLAHTNDALSAVIEAEAKAQQLEVTRL
jgi:GntR family transcriptional repressor for pyruvate dehydrogenase complex